MLDADNIFFAALLVAVLSLGVMWTHAVNPPSCRCLDPEHTRNCNVPGKGSPCDFLWDSKTGKTHF